MEKGNIFGQMGGNMLVLGKIESNMEKENFIFLARISGEKEYGIMVKELNGLMKMII